MDVSAYRGCGSARHMMPANAPKNSQPTMRSTPFARPTLACLAGGGRDCKKCIVMEIFSVFHNPYIQSSSACSRSALQSLRSPSCLFDSFSMCIDLDLDPIDQPVCPPGPLERRSGAEQLARLQLLTIHDGGAVGVADRPGSIQLVIRLPVCAHTRVVAISPGAEAPPPPAVGRCS